MKTISGKCLFLALTAIIVSVLSYSQIIEVDPIYPTVADEVDVTLHVNRCNCSLEGYTGDIYAHTGLITGESVDLHDWKFVVADWNVNLEKARLEKLDDTTYVLHITPTITDYYEITPETEVQNLVFVFRNPDGSKQTSPDIFYEVYEQGLTIQINEPEGNVVVKQGDTITIAANAVALGTTIPDSLTLYIDDIIEYISYADTLYYELEVTNTDKHWIKVEAKNDEFTSVDSLFYFVRNDVPTADLPPGVRDGINYIDTATVTLVLHARYKDNVIVIGDFNDWDLSNDYLMNRTPDSARYWLTISDLTKGEEYAFQYLVDGNLRIAEPYTDKILDPVNDQYIPDDTYPDLKPYPAGLTEGIVSVFQTGQQEYDWIINDFVPSSVTDLVIYELHIRDFVASHDFKTVMDSLNYLEELGVNAIELMPVSEFEGNDSWGYNPSFYFAVDKYYGTKNDFKEFIDECHSRGMAVIMDIVLNHSYGQSPLVQLYFDEQTGKPTAQNPWYNQDCPHQPWCWGYDFNHESEATRTFVNRVNRYWLEEYNIDGYRFDFTKGFTNTVGDGWNYDASRITILKAMYDSIKLVNENALVIFEHLSENTEETELSNYGILLWGKMTDPYNEATMGYHDSGKSNLSGISYQYRGWDEPHLVGYMESHDEQRLMYKNETWGNSQGDYDVKDLNTGLSRVEAAAAFFFTVPGPKMVWQFGELGYDVNIDYPCRVCPKPILWEYYDNSNRYRLYKVFSALIELRIEEDLFETVDFTLNVTAAMKRINLNSASMNAVILGNFDLSAGSIAGNFQHTGTWYEYFTGNILEVTSTDQSIELQPGEYRMYTDVQLELPDIPPYIDIKPEEDTICDNDQSYITLSSFSNFTQPIEFSWSAWAENVGTVAVLPVGPIGGLTADSVISYPLDNLTDNAQRVYFRIEPYTIDSLGSINYIGEADTVEVWVEPILIVDAEPEFDTINDGDHTHITLSSTSNPTQAVEFRWSAWAENAGNVAIVPVGPIAGLTVDSIITYPLDNLSDDAQRVYFRIEAYSMDFLGGINCIGEADTVEVWLESSPLHFNTAYSTSESGMLFPNPTNGIIHFKLLSKGNMEFTLYSPIGQPVYKRKISTEPDDTITFNLMESHSDIPKGLYFYTIWTPGYHMQGRLIVE